MFGDNDDDDGDDGDDDDRKVIAVERIPDAKLIYILQHLDGEEGVLQFVEAELARRKKHGGCQ
jgi:hypothetical protein